MAYFERVDGITTVYLPQMKERRFAQVVEDFSSRIFRKTGNTKRHLPNDTDFSQSKVDTASFLSFFSSGIA